MSGDEKWKYAYIRSVYSVHRKHVRTTYLNAGVGFPWASHVITAGSPRLENTGGWYWTLGFTPTSGSESL